MASVIECVVNVSEGRDESLLDQLASSCGRLLLDLHRDADHHRSVFTIAGDAEGVDLSVRALASAVVAAVDISSHAGAHPRIGALDVVPFVSLVDAADGSGLVDGPDEPALVARDEFARWAGQVLGMPCFVYGPERTLPELRRTAWRGLSPDFGPDQPDSKAGAIAVGARRVLVAYNLWLSPATDIDEGRRVADALRQPHVRTLALDLAGTVQVSCNLIDPWTVGPAAVFDAVASQVAIDRAELVGLIPRGVLHAAPSHRWDELDLDPSRTIEARLERAGLDGGRLDLKEEGSGGKAPGTG